MRLPLQKFLLPKRASMAAVRPPQTLFQCRLCSSQVRVPSHFGYSYHLLSHVCYHHASEAERPFKCPYCGVLKVSPSLVLSHLKEKHPDRPGGRNVVVSPGITREYLDNIHAQMEAAFPGWRVPGARLYYPWGKKFQVENGNSIF